MDLLTLTSEFSRLGLHIESKSDGSLVVQPKGLITPQIREAIQSHKPTLLALYPPQEPDPFNRSVIKDLFDKMAPECPEGFTLAKSDCPWLMDEAEHECNASIQAKDQPRLLKALIVLEATMRDLFFRFEERRAIQTEDQAPPQATAFTFTAEKRTPPVPKAYQTPVRIPAPESVHSFAVLPEEWESHCEETSRDPWPESALADGIDPSEWNESEQARRLRKRAEQIRSRRED